MNISIVDAITAIVEFTLPRGSDSTKLLHIPIDARVYCYGDDEEYCESRDVHLLFHRPGNYTKVFVGMENYSYVARPDGGWHKWGWEQVSDERGISLNDINWHMTSNHDSCWRSDGVSSPLSIIRQDMEKCIVSNIPRTDYDLSWDFSLDGITGRMKFVTADVVVDEEANLIRRPNGGDTHLKKPINITGWK